MAYIITKSDGTTLTTITDGSIDTVSTNLSLPGPNYVGYGQYLNENLVHLLENFAANSAPAGTNIQGQLWFDKFHQRLNVFTVNGFTPVSGITNSGTAPVITNDGEFWFDTYNNQFYVSNSGSWNIIGPQYNKAQGVSGAIPIVVDDALVGGRIHNILQLQYGNVIIGTLSGDTQFTPKNYDPGFPTINAGLTINSNISAGQQVLGIAAITSGTVTGLTNLTATNATIGSITATNNTVTNFSTANAQITGGNVLGLTNLTTANAAIANFSTTNAQITGGAIAVATVSTGAVSTVNSTVTGSQTVTTQTVTNQTVTNFSTANALITGGNISGISTLIPNGNTAVNLGGTSNWWNNIYGTAVHAQYADLAENYLADAEYDPGTVLMFGGSAEVTVASSETTALAGVVSTNPAYIMNSKLSGPNVVTIALIGRVPCKVVGPINKGDLLVSAGSGLAKSAVDTKPGQVIGRSMESVDENIQKTVEIVVGRIG